MRMKIKRYLVISDLQIPYHHETAVKNVIKLARKEKFDSVLCVGDEINASALKILTDAKRLAPVNFGQLRNQIALDPINNLTYGVEAKASYSAYVEFGTGPQVSVPADFTSYAAQFQGKKGGKFKDFVDALTLWVKRKGIGDGKNDRGLAYVIARSILQKM